MKEVANTDNNASYWDDYLHQAIIMTMWHLSLVTIISTCFFCYTKKYLTNIICKGFATVILLVEFIMSTIAIVLTVKAFNILEDRNKLLKDLDKSV